MTHYHRAVPSFVDRTDQSLTKPPLLQSNFRVHCWWSKVELRENRQHWNEFKIYVLYFWCSSMYWEMCGEIGKKTKELAQTALFLFALMNFNACVIDSMRLCLWLNWVFGLGAGTVWCGSPCPKWNQDDHCRTGKTSSAAPVDQRLSRHMPRHLVLSRANHLTRRISGAEFWLCFAPGMKKVGCIV